MEFEYNLIHAPRRNPGDKGFELVKVLSLDQQPIEAEILMVVCPTSGLGVEHLSRWSGSPTSKIPK